MDRKLTDRSGNERHWFEDVADHLGAAYLRYSFTKGTEQEVTFLVDALGLAPGARVLDVGCGPGRHAFALAARGISVVGVDISERFISLARENTPPGLPVTFERADARSLPFSEEFDAVLSLCQGAFGLSAGGGVPGDRLDPDRPVLEGMARALRPGGSLAVSAFSAYFQVRYLGEADSFDAERGVNHEHTAVRNQDGVEVPVDLWTTCFTPRELRLLAESAGLRPDHVWSVTPGEYAANPPDVDHHEFLLLATSTRPPLITSTCATAIASGPGRRKVALVTSVPRRMVDVSRAMPASVTQESVGPGCASGPAGSPPIRRKWSDRKKASKPSRSASCATASCVSYEPPCCGSVKMRRASVMVPPFRFSEAHDELGPIPWASPLEGRQARS